jgi:uncharacterized protein
MSSAPRRISRDVARRFLLGRAGLWPGRRWQGMRGTEQAMRSMEHVQLDPLRVVARAQDLALHSRVVDYREGDWAVLTHERRRFFEWGGWLAVRPMDELPFFRVLMRRSHDHDWPRWAYAEHRPAIEEMREVLGRRDEVANRDFAIRERTRVESYRGRKDSSIALHYLWRVGEAMVARRTSTFERVYARPDLVAPPRFRREAVDDEAEDYLLLKAVRASGFSKLGGARAMLLRDISNAELAAWRERKVASGVLAEVVVEGLFGRHVMPAAELPDLDALTAGRIPRSWRPRGPTTAEEVTFLSPLDPVIHDRERTRRLFGFDYKWGVYDKVETRRYGYYDLPILYGDRLVGRADLRANRTTGELEVLGYWDEPGSVEDDEGYRAALERGLDRLARLVTGSPAT